MLYALLCYDSEDVAFSRTRVVDDAVMVKLSAVQKKLAAARKLGLSLRLMPTTAAVTRREGDPPRVMDGPCIETRDQLLGVYVLDCDDLEDALKAAVELGRANPGGVYEIRPLRLFAPGVLKARTGDA